MFSIAMYQELVVRAEPFIHESACVHLHWRIKDGEEVGYLALSPAQAEALAAELLRSARRVVAAAKAREAVMAALEATPE